MCDWLWNYSSGMMFWSCIQWFLTCECLISNRYPFYMLSCIDMDWKVLTWFRYTVWIPLYPIGCLAEGTLKNSRCYILPPLSSQTSLSPSASFSLIHGCWTYQEFLSGGFPPQYSCSPDCSKEVVHFVKVWKLGGHALHASYLYSSFNLPKHVHIDDFILLWQTPNEWVR